MAFDETDANDDVKAVIITGAGYRRMIEVSPAGRAGTPT
jgi:hypothetical protein